MFWINKNRRCRRCGHKVTNDFIRKAWNAEEHKYIGCTFEEFKRDGRMERVLHREQRGYCCYCMRHLNVGVHTTIEHVMPHKCKTKIGGIDWEKINYYKQYNRNFKKKVAYIHLDGTDRRWKAGAPYPHFCAYENLTLSCDGSLFTEEDEKQGKYPSKLHLCCNNHRGDKTILPVFYIRNIEKLISYDGEDGIILFNTKSHSYQEQLSKTIDDLKLDHQRLQIIRRSWYRIARSGLYSIADVMEAKKEENLELRKNIILDSGIPISDYHRIVNPIYWSLLSEYYWFYKYFKKNKDH